MKKLELQSLIVQADAQGIYGVAHTNTLMNWNDSFESISGWFLSKGYTPI